MRHYGDLLDKSEIRYKQVVYPQNAVTKAASEQTRPVQIELIVEDMSQLETLINNSHHELLLQKTGLSEDDTSFGIEIQDRP